MNPTKNEQQRTDAPSGNWADAPSGNWAGAPTSRWIGQATQRMLVLALFAAAGAARAGGGPIQGVVNGVNIVLATVTAVCLALATIGVGICGYKVIFDGATFRDVSNKLLGSAIAGSAGAIAAMFMTN